MEDSLETRAVLLRPHYTKEYIWRIYEEFHKTSYTLVILHLFFCVYRRVCNRLLFKILHNFE